MILSGRDGDVTDVEGRGRDVMRDVTDVGRDATWGGRGGDVGGYDGIDMAGRGRGEPGRRMARYRRGDVTGRDWGREVTGT